MTLVINSMTSSVGIPSPSVGVWWLGPIPLRAYGIIIVTGMLIGVFLARQRYTQRGGDGDLLFDMAMWVLPMGIIGARLYHVFANAHYYFANTQRMLEIPRIWEGGLAIWGGIIAGVVTAYIFVRRHQVRLAPIADSIAPTVLLAQAMGRWGNYFNQELFGSPTTLPWGLQIDDAHLPPGYQSGTLFHPTFLYESLWNFTAFGLILWLDRRFTFKGGQVMCMYFFAYAPIRIVMETLRLDPAYEFLGIRQNAWASILALLIAIVVFIYLGQRGESSSLSEEEHERAMMAAAQRSENQGRTAKAKSDVRDANQATEMTQDSAK